MRLTSLLMASVTSLTIFSTASLADTTDQKWMTKVEITKQGPHCTGDPNCFNRYHPEVPSKASANVGDMIVFHTRDALDSEFKLDSNADDLATVDLGSQTCSVT